MKLDPPFDTFRIEKHAGEYKDFGVSGDSTYPLKGVTYPVIIEQGRFETINELVGAIQRFKDPEIARADLTREIELGIASMKNETSSSIEKVAKKYNVSL